MASNAHVNPTRTGLRINSNVSAYQTWSGIKTTRNVNALASQGGANQPISVDVQTYKLCNAAKMVVTVSVLTKRAGAPS